MASFTGGSGNDSLVVVGGTNSYDGLGGTDRLIFTPTEFQDAVVAKTGPLSGTVTVGGDVSTFTNMENLTFIDGRLTVDIADRMALVYRMYDTVLDRVADHPGLENWNDLLAGGGSLQQLAQAFYGSAEGQARYGAMNDSTFVGTLYTDALNRTGSAGEIQGWVDLLNAGHTRAEVLVGFSESSEHISLTAGSIQAGLFDLDTNATRVAIGYNAALGRAPDQAGAEAFLAYMALPNTSFRDFTNILAVSPEFADHHSGQTSTQFVTALYQEGLGRTPAGAEAQGWITGLDNATLSRADVLYGVAASAEALNHAYTIYDTGILFS